MGAPSPPVPLGRSLFGHGGRYAGSRRAHRLAEVSPSRGGRQVPRHGVTAPPGSAEARRAHRAAGDTPARGGLTVRRGIRRLAEGSPYRGWRHIPRHGVTAPPGSAQAEALTGSRRARRPAGDTPGRGGLTVSRTETRPPPRCHSITGKRAGGSAQAEARKRRRAGRRQRMLVLAGVALA